jgi:hypothetical protein
MSSDDHWITVLIAECRSSHSLVTGAVSIHLEQMLKGGLQEHKLSKNELTSLAQVLIRGMIPTTLEAELRQ